MKKDPKFSHSKTYRGRIKATKGLNSLTDPKTKPLSHRIVRRKMEREMNKEIQET